MPKLLNALPIIIASCLTVEIRAANMFEGFDGDGGAGPSWETAEWRNEPFFGCRFSSTEVWRTGTGEVQLNVNNSVASDIKCAEIRAWPNFLYGKFVTRIRPGTIPGGNTAFFLITDTTGDDPHYEIDLEFIREGKVLHTNVWTAGKQNYEQVKIDAGWRTIGFEWRPEYIRFFHVDDKGKEQEFRRMNARISSPMRLMLNHWIGDNSSSSVTFLAPYTNQGGAALVDWIQVSN